MATLAARRAVPRRPPWHDRHRPGEPPRPLLHRRRVGGAVVRRDDRRDRLRHRGAVLPRRRGAGRRHGARRRGGPHRVRRGPVAGLTHAERAEYLRALGDGAAWSAPTTLGRVVAARDRRHPPIAQYAGDDGAGGASSSTRRWPTRSRSRSEPRSRSVPGFGLLVREPVGVVGAIIPWNSPLGAHRPQDRSRRCWPGARSCSSCRPRRRARATSSPRPRRQIGLPPGVLNVVTADREVSELLVHDPRVDKITFTGSTAAGRRIASLCGERIARVHARARRQVGRGDPRRRRHRRGGRERSPAPSAS